MKTLDSYTTIIFDLDNTLYNELEYLSRAYCFISNKISRFNPDSSQQDICNYLLEEYNKNGRKDVYQKLITKFNCIDYSLTDFLNDLRNVPISENSIQIKEEFYSFIISNKDKYRFFIATNGNQIQQENKFKSVNIPCKRYFSVIYCDNFGIDKRKPNPFFINYISKNFSIKHNEMIFVGDSVVDYSAAKNGGIDFLYTEEFNKKIRTA